MNLARVAFPLTFLAMLAVACGSTDDSGSGQAGSGGSSSEAGSGGSSQAGSGGSAQAGSGSSQAGGGGSSQAGSGGSGQAGSGGSDFCSTLCAKDESLTAELKCKPSTCAAQCPQALAAIQQAGCESQYKAFSDCAIDEPSSSYTCDEDGGTQISDTVCVSQRKDFEACVLPAST